MNYKRCLIVLFFLVQVVSVCSQTKREADSLTKIILSGNDTLKIMAYDEFSRLSCGIDNRRALLFAFKSLSFAKKDGRKKFTASAYNRIGSVYDYDSRPDSANAYYLNALKIYEELNDQHGKGNVYQNLGVMYYYQEDFINAYRFYMLAIECRKKTGEEKAMAQVYNNIGAMLRQQEKYDQALEMYRQALAIKIKYNDKKSLSATYQNMATVYDIKKEYPKAFELMEKSIQIDKELGNYDDLAKSYLGLAVIYVGMSKLKEAEKYVMMSLEMAEKNDNSDSKFKAYEMLSVVDTLNRNYRKGIQSLMMAKKLKGKVFREEKTTAIEKLQIIYETEKKDNEIALLNSENENKSKRQKMLYIIISLTILFLFITLFFYNKKRKDNILLARQKMEIVEKTEQLNLQAAEIAKHRSQMNPHFVFNALNALQGNILKGDDEKTLKQLTAFSKLTRLTLNNSDKEWISIAEELNYLKEYINFEKQRLDFEFYFNINIDSLIDSENCAIPPMLLQPLIENSIKHAQLHLVKDPEITLTIKKQSEQLKIMVKDNGKGIRVISNNINQSKAISILQKRIVEINRKEKHICETPFVIMDLKDQNNNPVGTECIIELHYSELI